MVSINAKFCAQDAKVEHAKLWSLLFSAHFWMILNANKGRATKGVAFFTSWIYILVLDMSHRIAR